MSPTRVLYSFPHPVGRPGIGTTALQQVRALARAGAQVTLVCTSLHADVGDEVRVVETLRVAGRRLPHRALGSPDRALAYHDHRAARLLRREHAAFDVVHTWPQSALRTIEEARRHGVLAVREVPNTHTANAYEQASAEVELLGLRLGADHAHRPDPRHLRLEEAEYAAADLLMVPSDHVAETFLERGVPESRLGRHQYGYDPASFTAAGRVEAPVRPFTAVFVGRAEPRKGLHYALEAWSRADLPAGATFLVAGGFVPGYRDHLAPLLERPDVRTLGFVDDVPALLRRSDVLLLPSVEEGSALVTYEAQASGCVPLVSTAAGALLPPGAAGLAYPPRTTRALVDQLTLLGNDGALRRQLRHQVLAWSDHLTWDAAARRMLALYADGQATLRRLPVAA